MSVEKWLKNFGNSISVEDLVSPACELISFIKCYAEEIVEFIEARNNENFEIVVLDFRTDRPQDSVYPIKPVERIGVLFHKVNPMPTVYILRDDFPDTEHQLLTSEGAPCAICIDNRTWDEARLNWTSAELIKRIFSWFSRAAKGELHDPQQLLDPNIIGSSINFSISRDVFHQQANFELVARHDPKNRQSLRICKVEELLLTDCEPIFLVTYSIPPENMRRLVAAPDNLNFLVDLLKIRDVDLLIDLRIRFTELLSKGVDSAWNLNSRFAVILEMPIISPNDTLHKGTDLRAFITEKSVGDIAIDLGIAMKATPSDGSEVGFIKRIPSGEIDFDALKEIKVQSAEVHFEFDRKVATKISGQNIEDDRKAVLVGAGSIGSHVANCLIREGRFQWTIIDYDSLLPHNLARHTANKNDIFKKKASVVANNLLTTLDSKSTVAKSICSNLMSEGDDRLNIDQALNEANLIIDATAFIPVERYLSDHTSNARRSCIFFNPAGDAVVLLVEPIDRSLKLRDLETQYLRLVLHDNKLANHLVPPTGTYAYTGACRAKTNLIPMSQVMALSGIVANGLVKALDQKHPTIKIWSLNSSGGVQMFEPDKVSIMCSFEGRGWTISIDQGLIQRINSIRNEHLPNETGGVLVGIVDKPAKCIQLVDAAPAPPDSKSTLNSFERGMSDVKEYLEDVYNRTQTQVRYLGEWHSHPLKAGILPSQIDQDQINWLETLCDIEALPLMMVIAGDQGVGLVMVNKQKAHRNTVEAAYL